MPQQDMLRDFKANIFQALAHPTRIAIVEMLRQGEVPPSAIVDQLGIEQANASQHLAVLRARRVVLGRKVGNQIFYSIRDPLLFEVLDILRRYFETNLHEASEMLSELAGQNPATSGEPAAAAPSARTPSKKSPGRTS